MKTRTMVRVLLCLIGVSVSALGGGIAGLLLMASLHPGHKGPHITDGQAVGAFALGALLGGGLAAILLIWMRKRRKP